MKNRITLTWILISLESSVSLGIIAAPQPEEERRPLRSSRISLSGQMTGIRRGRPGRSAHVQRRPRDGGGISGFVFAFEDVGAISGCRTFSLAFEEELILELTDLAAELVVLGLKFVVRRTAPRASPSSIGVADADRDSLAAGDRPPGVIRSPRAHLLNQVGEVDQLGARGMRRQAFRPRRGMPRTIIRRRSHFHMTAGWAKVCPAGKLNPAFGETYVETGACSDSTRRMTALRANRSHRDRENPYI